MAKKVLSGKSKYQEVEAATGVPWWVIGALHGRESSCNFKTHLHNGDPLTKRTTHVPANRPKSGSPPFTWEESAIDALTLKGLEKIKDWPIERVCYEAERYNGWGYRGKGKSNSPYLWAGTSNYTSGKYVADHVYSASAVDQQSGVMAVLKVLSDLDPDCNLCGDVAQPLSPKAGPVEDDDSPAPSEPDSVETESEKSPGLVKFEIIQDLYANSKKWLWLRWQKITGGGSAALGLASLGEDQHIPVWVFIVALIVLGILMWFFASWVQSKMIKDTKEGRYVPSGKAV